MDDLLAARTQMAVSLGFHIIFAIVGMAMPALMVVAQLLHRRTGDEIYVDLAKRWAKGTAILFAVGAVSGTALSFELGLLWPRFMELAGPLVGTAFTMEGYAFFLEAIALGVYLYGWDKVPANVHLGSGVVVAISGLLSGVFVTSVNGFMNEPAGFRVVDGVHVPHDPVAAFLNGAFFSEALHMSLAAYASVGLLVLGVHAWRLRKGPTGRARAFHEAGARIAFGVAAVSVPLLLVSGDLSAKHIARDQPIKLAAAEGHYETERGAAITVVGPLEVPGGLSFLAFGDFDAEVKGLNDFPEDERPPVPVVFTAFRVMVGAGSAMMLLVLWGLARVVRKRGLLESRAFLTAAALAAPLGVLAVEAGWTVTEVGRQPWIIVGVMRTVDAVTPMPGLWLPCALFCGLYLFLGLVVVSMLRAHVFLADEELAS
jgi:cytochrome d ubiquinol oxidase subunit I